MPDQPAGPVPDQTLAQDAARITAELARLQGGTDPFATAVRVTRMPMIVTDPRQPDDPVIFTSDSFCRLSGYARHEIVGRNCRFLQGAETNPATGTASSWPPSTTPPGTSPGGGRRADGPHAGDRCARGPRLRHAGSRGRRQRIGRAPLRPPDRFADHRCRPARRHERPPGRRGGPRRPPRAARPVHHRLRGKRQPSAAASSNPACRSSPSPSPSKS